MSFVVGDIVISDRYMGVVTGLGPRVICQDCVERTFQTDTCTKLFSYKEVLESFERSILDAHR